MADAASRPPLIFYRRAVVSILPSRSRTIPLHPSGARQIPGSLWFATALYCQKRQLDRHHRCGCEDDEPSIAIELNATQLRIGQWCSKEPAEIHGRIQAAARQATRDDRRYEKERPHVLAFRCLCHPNLHCEQELVDPFCVRQGEEVAGTVQGNVYRTTFVRQNSVLCPMNRE